MQRKKKVLIFSGGTDIVLEIWKLLKDCKDIILFQKKTLFYLNRLLL